jgi:hypothetical protein
MFVLELTKQLTAQNIIHLGAAAKQLQQKNNI